MHRAALVRRRRYDVLVQAAPFRSSTPGRPTRALERAVSGVVTVSLTECQSERTATEF